MEVVEKPLQPLSHGIVLLVGVKASNFDDDIRNHPRVVMWDSQQQHWAGKDLPHNTRAVFVTRFLGHAEFSHIIKEARKRQITIFNPQGTGVIAKQVRELLDITRLHTVHEVGAEIITPAKEDEMTPKAKAKTGGKVEPKLHVLHKYIDWDKNNIENARYMLTKAEELGIETTLASLAQSVGVQRKKHEGKPTRHKESTRESGDISVQMFDNAIKELKDMRQLFIDTVNENAKLKAKLDKFRRFFED